MESKGLQHGFNIVSTRQSKVFPSSEDSPVAPKDKFEARPQIMTSQAHGSRAPGVCETNSSAETRGKSPMFPYKKDKKSREYSTKTAEQSAEEQIIETGTKPSATVSDATDRNSVNTAGKETDGKSLSAVCKKTDRKSVNTASEQTDRYPVETACEEADRKPMNTAWEDTGRKCVMEPSDEADRKPVVETPDDRQSVMEVSEENGQGVRQLDELTTIQELDETGTVMRAFRGMGQVNVGSGEFHMGNQVNVTHAHGDLHHHVGTLIKKQQIYHFHSDDTAGYDQIKDQSAVEMQSEEHLFVETSAYHKAVDLLTTRGLLAVHGPPRSGKSTLGRALLRHFAKHQYTPLVLHTPAEWRCHVGGGRRQVVLLDGVFGDVRLDTKALGRWSSSFTSMEQYARTDQCLVVITAYAHIASEIRCNGQFADFFLNIPVFDFDAIRKYSDTEMKEMIEKYLQVNRKAVTDTVVRELLAMPPCGPVFPWVVRQYCGTPAGSEQRAAILSMPEQAYLPFLTACLSERELGRCFAAVMLVTMKTQNDSGTRAEDLQQVLQDTGLQDCSVTTVENMRWYFSESFLSPDGARFSSRIVYNAVGLALGASEFLPSLLKVCDVKFLVQYIRHDGAGETLLAPPGLANCKLHVDSRSPGYNVVLQRIGDEITGGNIPAICQLQALQVRSVLEDFKTHCQSQGTFDLVLDAKDSRQKQMLLYWSVFCPQSVLTCWCLAEMVESKPQNKQLLAEMQQVLFVCALSGRTTHSDIMKTVAVYLRPFGQRLCRAERLKLPLPLKKQQLAKEVTTVCEQIWRRALSDVVCYLGNPSLPVPKELLSVQTARKKVQVNLPGKHWYVALRLLADTTVDEQDNEGNTLLHVAAMVGDADDVKMAVRSGASLTAKNNKSATPPDLARRRFAQVKNDNRSLAAWPVLEASRFDDLDGLKVVLCLGAGVNDTNSERQTLLHLTCELGKTQAALLLVQLHAYVDAVDRNGYTALHYACQQGHIDTAVMLIANGAKLRRNRRCMRQSYCKTSYRTLSDFLCFEMNAPLHAACLGHHTDIAELLLHHGASVNEKDGLGRTPLHIACENNGLEMASFLVDNGADIHAIDNKKRTPLHVTTERDFLHIVAFLMQRGAHCVDVEGEDEIKAALLPACENGNIAIVQNLIHCGVDINVKGSGEKTPLHMACSNGHGHIASVLIEHSADVNAKAKNMETPLHAACRHGFPSIANLLLIKGADVNASLIGEETVLHLASSEGQQDMITLLLQFGAGVNIKDSQGETALYGACRNGHQDVVRLLISHGADVQMTDKKQETPLHCACREGKTDIAAPFSLSTVPSLMLGTTTNKRLSSMPAKQDMQTL